MTFILTVTARGQVTLRKVPAAILPTGSAFAGRRPGGPVFASFDCRAVAPVDAGDGETLLPGEA
jgi:hypothetical protein